MMLYGKEVSVSDCGLKTMEEVRESKNQEVSITPQLYTSALELDLLLGCKSVGNPSNPMVKANTASSTGSDFVIGMSIGSILL